MRVNNLLKVIMRRKRGAAGIVQPTDPENDTLTTQPWLATLVQNLQFAQPLTLWGTSDVANNNGFKRMYVTGLYWKPG